MLIAWTPLWTYLFLLTGFVLSLIAIMVFQKKGKITYSLSPESWKKIVRKRSLGFALLLAGIGLMIAAIRITAVSEYKVEMIVGGVFVIIASLFAFAFASPIRAIKFRNGWFRVKGCGPEFLDSLPVIDHSPFA